MEEGRERGEAVAGLIEEIRSVEGTERRTLDIEAGPLLQAENMINRIQRTNKNCNKQSASIEDCLFKTM